MFPFFLLIAALLVLGWALWFLVELIRYVASGEYEMDRRLQAIRRKEGSS